ncbi:ABC transporter substrate-binding protein [Streptomyces qinzhouensis]|uniref:Peptide ABC transporter substrate-binding protein n=1 Tax=Streptomyces qinzhouensis TaxID=2599401 RepID=A0A5B8JNE3_9ACTN|nr:peptide ABC transporter substrate-binding protein [Streptomyces qinzhouensis]QDY79320.1 peptide ABC transporter substrate-binding protein [Streptomyces qinzhouensis]
MVTTVPSHPPTPPGPGPAPRPHRRLRRYALGAAGTLLAVPPLPAAAAGHPDGGGQKKVLTIAVSQSVDSLSPFLAQRLVSTSIHRLAYEYLTNYDVKDGRPAPGLATSWTSSPSKLIWTYTIRRDSRWSDGRPVTAADAAWTFNKIMSDEGAATASGSFTTNFRKVTAPDPGTLVVELKRPQATMLALDIPIVPRHIWEKVRSIPAFTNDRQFPIVGSGPFVITDFKVDRHLRLRANRDFWQGAPHFDELLLKYYKDGDAAVAALRKGEVSFVQGLTPAQAAALKSMRNIRVNDAPGRRFLALATNPGARSRDGNTFGSGHPALLDPAVRRALFHAVDRTALVTRVFRGHAEEGEGYIPPRYTSYHWKPAAGQRIGYDPARAAALLDRAGYRRTAGGKRTGRNGRPLSFRILCHATDPNDRAIGKYLQEWWGALGIGLRVDCLDNVSDPWLKGDYDLAFDGWSVNPDPDFALAIHTCAALPATPADTGSTDNFICDRRYDELYRAQAAEYEPTARAELVKRLQSRLYDTGFMNVIAYPNAVEAYRTDHIQSITTMPEAAGNIWGQDGYWSWWSAKPAAGAGDGGPDDDAAGGLLLGLGAGLVPAVVLTVLVVMRRRATVEDRE